MKQLRFSDKGKRELITLHGTNGTKFIFPAVVVTKTEGIGGGERGGRVVYQCTRERELVCLVSTLLQRIPTGTTVSK